MLSDSGRVCEGCSRKWYGNGGGGGGDGGARSIGELGRLVGDPSVASKSRLSQLASAVECVAITVVKPSQYSISKVWRMNS